MGKKDETEINGKKKKNWKKKTPKTKRNWMKLKETGRNRKKKKKKNQLTYLTRPRQSVPNS